MSSLSVNKYTYYTHRKTYSKKNIYYARFYRNYSYHSYSSRYQKIDYKKIYQKNLKNQYINKKNSLNESLNTTIKEIQNRCDIYSKDFQHIHEFVDLLKNKKEKILKDFTFDVFNSSLDWLNTEIQEFNEKSIKIRQFLKTLELEHKDGLTLQSYELLLKSLPEEFKRFKQELEKKALMIIDERIQAYQNSKDQQKLEELYYEIPSYFTEPRNKIANELLKKQFSEQKSLNKANQSQEILTKNIKQLKSEVDKFYQKLLQISKSEADLVKSNYEESQESNDPTRIWYILKDIKIRYAKLKHQYIESEALKEDVKSTYLDIPIPEIKQAIEEFLNKEIVSKEDYNELMSFINETIQKEEEQEEKETMIHLIYENLRKLGYAVIDEDAMKKLQTGEVVEIQSPFGEEYVVRLKIEKDNINMRFVRYVEDENQLSNYEKEKDISIGKQWCKTYDNILKYLKDKGILLEEKYRVEPEEKFYYEKKEKLYQKLQQQKKPDNFKRNL